MRKIIARLVRASIVPLFIFTLVNTNVKAGNETKYIKIQKENNNAIKEEIIKEEPLIEASTGETMVEEKPLIETSTGETMIEEEPVTNEQVNDADIKTETINYGTYGRLYIANYSVALYDYNVNTTSNISLQTIVNNYDSAAFYRNYDKLVIADHNNQGFSILYGLNEGSTSYIQFEDGSVIRYRLIKKASGTNTGPDLVDNEGNSFFNMDSDIIMYTCYNGGIMATIWVQI